MYQPANNNRALRMWPLLAHEVVNDTGVQTERWSLHASPSTHDNGDGNEREKKQRKKKRLRK